MSDNGNAGQKADDPIAEAMASARTAWERRRHRISRSRPAELSRQHVPVRARRTRYTGAPVRHWLDELEARDDDSVSDLGGMDRQGDPAACE